MTVNNQQPVLKAGGVLKTRGPGAGPGGGFYTNYCSMTVNNQQPVLKAGGVLKTGGPGACPGGEGWSGEEGEGGQI